MGKTRDGRTFANVLPSCAFQRKIPAATSERFIFHTHDGRTFQKNPRHPNVFLRCRKSPRRQNVPRRTFGNTHDIQTFCMSLKTHDVRTFLWTQQKRSVGMGCAEQYPQRQNVRVKILLPKRSAVTEPMAIERFAPKHARKMIASQNVLTL